MSKSISPGDFINSYPNFQFDLEEYIYSTQYSNYLKKKFIFFRDYISHNFSIMKYDEKIVAALKNSFSNTIPGYRSLYNVKEITDIPFMDKTSLRKSPKDFVNKDFVLEELWCKDTSGTTGPPVRIYYSPEFYFEHLYLAVPKVVARARHLNDEFSSIFCFAPTDNLSCEELIIVDPTKLFGFVLQIVVDESRQKTIDRFFQLLKTLKPKVITGKPSLFEFLIEKAPHTWLDEMYSPDIIINSGSFLDEDLRQKTQALFRSTVINAYGLTEFGLIASECPKRDGFHVDETSILVEIVDYDGNLLQPGNEGELVLSSIANTAMPLLRYRTGDLAAVDHEPCSCGSPGLKLRRLSGRKVSCFRFQSGALFSPAHFNNLFSLFPIDEFQITQLGVTRFEILVQPKSISKNIDHILFNIKKHVENSFPCKVEIEIRTAIFNSRSKFERYRTLI